MLYPNLFKSRYPSLRGKDWIKTIDLEDLKAFIQIGMKHGGYGVKGGRARASKGLRDKRGRFTRSTQ